MNSFGLTSFGGVEVLGGGLWSLEDTCVGLITLPGEGLKFLPGVLVILAVCGTGGGLITLTGVGLKTALLS